MPEMLAPVSYAQGSGLVKAGSVTIHPPAKKELIGVDVFLHHHDRDAEALGNTLQQVNGGGVKLVMISNRGQKVWPQGLPETFCTDHWRCRFMAEAEGTLVTHGQVIELLQRVAAAGFDFIKTENLYVFDGEKGFSLGQGQ
jgi:isocitrate dehydrogenase